MTSDVHRIIFGLLLSLSAACGSDSTGSPTTPADTADPADTSQDTSLDEEVDPSDVSTRSEVEGRTDASPVPDDAASGTSDVVDEVSQGDGVAPGDALPEPDTPEQEVASTDDAAVEVEPVDPPDDVSQDAEPTEVDADQESGPEGWPSNPDKDQIPNPGWDSAPAEGTVIPNFTAVDQYGDLVELYDLAGQGVPVVLDVGTWFCEPCKGLAAYLSDGDVSHMDPFLWWQPKYEVVRDMVNAGEIRWVTVLYSLGSYVGPEEVALWHEEFPNDNVVVLADSELQLQEYLSVSAMPRIDVLDENMVFVVYAPGGPAAGMQYLSALGDDDE